MIDWTVIYIEMALMLIVGAAVGVRATMYYYRWQRIRLIARWKHERRKHRQRNPWVKTWVHRNRSFPWVRIGKNQYEMPDGVFYLSLHTARDNSDGQSQTIKEPTYSASGTRRVGSRWYVHGDKV